MKMGFPSCFATTRRVAKLLPSRVGSTSKTICLAGFPPVTFGAASRKKKRVHPLYLEMAQQFLEPVIRHGFAPWPWLASRGSSPL